MTINVVVATYHVVVLGCDSLSSIVERAFFPFRHDSDFALDAAGNPIRDREGNLAIPYREDRLVTTATNVMGGVQKMFLLYERESDPDNAECSVAATTSGLGTLNGVTIAELAARFRRSCAYRPLPHQSAETVVTDFMAFLRPLWEQAVDFEGTADMMRRWLPDLNFLVAGYGPGDDYTKVYRLSISDRSIEECFEDAPHCSAAWAGQSNTVASLINRIDPGLRFQVSKSIVEALAAQRQSIVESVLEQLGEHGALDCHGGTRCQRA